MTTAGKTIFSAGVAGERELESAQREAVPECAAGRADGKIRWTSSKKENDADQKWESANLPRFARVPKW